MTPPCSVSPASGASRNGRENGHESWLKRSPIVAILRGVKPDEVEPIVEALAESGILIVEVPLNSPQPFDSIGRARETFRRQDARRRRNGDEPRRRATCRRCRRQTDRHPACRCRRSRPRRKPGMFAVPGFFTPTEAFALLAAGADALKLVSGGSGRARGTVRHARGVSARYIGSRGRRRRPVQSRVLAQRRGRRLRRRLEHL